MDKKVFGKSFLLQKVVDSLLSIDQSTTSIL